MLQSWSAIQTLTQNLSNSPSPSSRQGRRFLPAGGSPRFCAQSRSASGTFSSNPIDRYKIGTDTKGLETAPDGSITTVISRDRPTGENASDWLPAPDG
jgi:hypothetical protein